MKRDDDSQRSSRLAVTRPVDHTPPPRVAGALHGSFLMRTTYGVPSASLLASRVVKTTLLNSSRKPTGSSATGGEKLSTSWKQKKFSIVSFPAARKLLTYVKKHWFFYLLVLPGALHMLIFKYLPMYGILIAFKNYNFRKGILASPWVGIENFMYLAVDSGVLRAVRNTLILNSLALCFGFTFTVFLALLLNEIKLKFYKRLVQTAIYFPYFLSWIVFAGIVTAILSPSEGVLGAIYSLQGKEAPLVMVQPELFRLVVVVTDTIKSAGFATIIYLAALSNVSEEIVESAIIDGANRRHLMFFINIPSILPTIAVLFVLRVANMFSSNFEQIWSLYNPAVYETGDVIATYIYRVGLGGGKFEAGTAMGLIFSVIGLVLLLLASRFIRRMNVMGIF